MPKPDNSILKRLQKLAEEVEREGPAFKDATTSRTDTGNITLAYVEPLEDN